LTDGESRNAKTAKSAKNDFLGGLRGLRVLDAGASRSGAFSVALGISLTRIVGLVRQRVLAHYFGLGLEADAWSAAFRIPNVLQNLFGDQALSASFIPVYASLVSRGEHREADRVAGAVFATLALIVAVLVLVGVLATPLLIGVIAPGFSGAKRELTTRLVRILFPSTGLLVLSAWCLGVLNTHRRFLVSYTAPIAWNAAMIAALIWFGGSVDLPRLAVVVAWGAVVGAALQFLVQVPGVIRVAPHLRFALDTASAPVRTVARNFGPVFISRGVVQISAYIDQLLASLLGTGAVAALTNAQLLSTLPVSLFGMAVSAAELPAMAAVVGLGREASAERHGALCARLEAGLRNIALFVVPSAMAFVALGDVVTAAIFETGRFTRTDTVYIWGILAGSSIGLLASTLGRLYVSTYYALGDTRTPLNCALVRVALTTTLGYLFALPLPRLLGLAPTWGAAGLTTSAGVAGLVEMMLLRSRMDARIGRTRLAFGYTLRLWLAALVAAAAAWGVKLAAPWPGPIATGAVVIGAYGLVYFGTAFALRVPEASAVWRRFGGRTARRL
jgi:putative peptidoglycan lipid II flippase